MSASADVLPIRPECGTFLGMARCYGSRTDYLITLLILFFAALSIICIVFCAVKIFIHNHKTETDKKPNGGQPKDYLQQMRSQNEW
jgi:hypothetical protein